MVKKEGEVEVVEGDVDKEAAKRQKAEKKEKKKEKKEKKEKKKEKKESKKRKKDGDEEGEKKLKKHKKDEEGPAVSFAPDSFAVKAEQIPDSQNPKLLLRAAMEKILELCKEEEDGCEELNLWPRMGEFDIQIRKAALNRLLGRHQLQLMKNALTGQMVFKYVDPLMAQRLQNLTNNEVAVFQLIEKEGVQALWISSIKKRSNLQQIEINAILKKLELRKLVKPVSSIHGKQKKYMLYDLEPLADMVGRAWQQGMEFDDVLINTLKQATIKCLQEHRGAFVTVSQVLSFINASGISSVVLDANDVNYTLLSLAFDGIVVPENEVYNYHFAAVKPKKKNDDDFDFVEENEVEKIRYRLSKSLKITTALGDVPCGTCPVAENCCTGNQINPETCKYMDTWLDF